MSEWKPIETAPKDGTTLILRGHDGSPYAPCIWSAAGEISENGFWLWWQNEPEWLTEIQDPTGWLPTPPKENEE